MCFNIITRSKRYSLFPILSGLIKPSFRNFRISLANGLFSPVGIGRLIPSLRTVLEADVRTADVRDEGPLFLRVKRLLVVSSRLEPTTTNEGPPVVQFLGEQGFLADGSCDNDEDAVVDGCCDLCRRSEGENEIFQSSEEEEDVMAYDKRGIEKSVPFTSTYSRKPGIDWLLQRAPRVDRMFSNGFYSPFGFEMVRFQAAGSFSGRARKVDRTELPLKEGCRSVSQQGMLNGDGDGQNFCSIVDGHGGISWVCCYGTRKPLPLSVVIE
ncbi:cysteine proteinases superfamily protein [Striga asiatica]|uniref:Cysteine proteinases superfamily protein n=1 Tax=Striga asiatica TaxID=4170 RepID=A0A5A7RLK8_STRAF|nr:cysteine proteinases superfamily protein [Striga asiatica]